MIIVRNLYHRWRYFTNFNNVSWGLETRCLRFENWFEITKLISLKWHIVRPNRILGEEVDFSLVLEMWPRWPNKHVVRGQWDDRFYCEWYGATNRRECFSRGGQKKSLRLRGKKRRCPLMSLLYVTWCRQILNLCNGRKTWKDSRESKIESWALIKLLRRSLLHHAQHQTAKTRNLTMTFPWTSLCAVTK